MGLPERSHTIRHISDASRIRRVAGILIFLNGNPIRNILSIGFILRFFCIVGTQRK
jgi:hypothetical protein